MKGKQHILVTGHRTEKIKKYLEEVDYKGFFEVIERIILQTFRNKEKYIFHVGGCEGWDNEISLILLKNWYTCKGFFVKSDINWKEDWSKKDIKDFEYIKKHIKDIIIMDTWYRERDRQMAQGCSGILAYCKEVNSWTWYTVKDFLQQNPSMLDLLIPNKTGEEKKEDKIKKLLNVWFFLGL